MTLVEPVVPTASPFAAESIKTFDISRSSPTSSSMQDDSMDTGGAASSLPSDQVPATNAVQPSQINLKLLPSKSILRRDSSVCEDGKLPSSSPSKTLSWVDEPVNEGAAALSLTEIREYEPR
jgi:hypothetical protein